MRYEHILPIYWSKGLFFASNLFYFDKTLNDIIFLLEGFGRHFAAKLIERFELTFFLKDKSTHLVDYTTACPLKGIAAQCTDYARPYPRIVVAPLNIIFSQIHSVNHRYPELYRLNILRLYLIKSYRGRCHALGKPVRGQRTWSNAWNAFNVNRTLRTYINIMHQQLRGKFKLTKINYRLTEKKYTSKKKKKKTERVKQKKIWF
jgi:ribosomal protein S13